jgi:1-aminocyclopropane-1-carboxylate synthase
MTNFLSSDLSYGDSLWGSRRINKALAGLYNESVYSPVQTSKDTAETPDSWFDPAEEVLPEQLITGVGCSAGLRNYSRTGICLIPVQFSISFSIH